MKIPAYAQAFASLVLEEHNDAYLNKSRKKQIYLSMTLKWTESDKSDFISVKMTQLYN